MAEPIQLPDPTGIARAAFADREQLEKDCRQKIHPKCWEVEPQGARLLIVLDQMPNNIGNIVVPERSRANNDMGSGWIISAGPAVGCGMDVARYPGAPLCASAQAVVGRRVYIGAHSGITMRFSVADRDYDSAVIAISDLDILFIDFSEDPLSVEEQIEADLERLYGGKEG